VRRVLALLIGVMAVSGCADQPDRVTLQIAAICHLDADAVRFQGLALGSLGPIWVYRAGGQVIHVVDQSGVEPQDGHRFGWAIECRYRSGEHLPFEDVTRQDMPDGS
jgi:hypothetical protein